MPSAAQEPVDAAHLVHVGRQPLYCRDGQVVGYELLFRDSRTATAAAVSNGVAATSRVIVNAFTEFGLETLLGNRLGFVNLTREFLVGELMVPFEPGQAVLEVLETIEVDAQVVAGVEALVALGHPIALDDFVWGSGHERLLQLASYVKLEVSGAEPAVVTAAVAACREYAGLKLVAERLETEAELQFARDLGFDLFQGYLLGRPQVVSVAALSPSQLQRIELLGHLSRPEIDLTRITEVVTLDPALTYRMLRASNSAAVGRRRRVSSVHEAIMVLGTTRLRQWLSLMAISDLPALGEDHLVSTVARSRLCQLVAQRLRMDAAPAFTAGMLVGVSQLLGLSPAELVGQLPLADNVAQALATGGGELGRVLATVRDYESGDLSALDRAPISGTDLAQDYLAALDWALRTYRDVVDAPTAGRSPAERSG